MLFTNSRTISKSNGQMVSMPFSVARTNHIHTPPAIPTIQPTQQPQQIAPQRTTSTPTQLTREVPRQKTLIQSKTTEKKPMKWGEPTWYLFHTLAEKVKEEHFQEIRKELLDVIYTICVNLPCPTCAVHAAQHMNGINFNTIQTKQQLKDMLFSFHNTVNARKQFPLFDYADLDTKYSAANTIIIIQNFMMHFQDKHSSIRMIANDLHRSRIANILKKWFNENIQYFQL